MDETLIVRQVLNSFEQSHLRWVRSSWCIINTTSDWPNLIWFRRSLRAFIITIAINKICQITPLHASAHFNIDDICALKVQDTSHPLPLRLGSQELAHRPRMNKFN